MCVSHSPSPTSRLICAVVVRSSLAPFDCTMRDGVRTMDAEPSIECGGSSGPHARMAVVGGITMALFGVGVPVSFTLFLFFNHEGVKADQRLRVKGEGDSALTNPNIQLRRR
jgi:hypothetical protein